MKERTRLDQIVREEFERERDGFGKADVNEKSVVDAFCRVGPRIAERAFRHGVEQCTEWANTHHIGYTNDVQPGPAVEKKPSAPHGCSLVWCGRNPGDAVHTDQQGCPDTFHPYRHFETYCVECGGADVRDRRKGQRRKDKPRPGQLFTPTENAARAIYQDIHGTNLWSVDRRSGKDRRKV